MAIDEEFCEDVEDCIEDAMRMVKSFGEVGLDKLVMVTFEDLNELFTHMVKAPWPQVSEDPFLFDDDGTVLLTIEDYLKDYISQLDEYFRLKLIVKLAVKCVQSYIAAVMDQDLSGPGKRKRRLMLPKKSSMTKKCSHVFGRSELKRIGRDYFAMHAFFSPLAPTDARPGACCAAATPRRAGTARGALPGGQGAPGRPAYHLPARRTTRPPASLPPASRPCLLPQHLGARRGSEIGVGSVRPLQSIFFYKKEKEKAIYGSKCKRRVRAVRSALTAAPRAPGAGGRIADVSIRACAQNVRDSRRAQAQGHQPPPALLHRGALGR